MLGFLSSKGKRSQVGVDFMPTGVAVVEVANVKLHSGKVIQCDFLPAVGKVDQAGALHDWVNKNNLQNTACNSLIARHDVQLFQLEKPAVEDEELLQAVRWKVNELINFDIESAVVDIFQLPTSPKSPVTYIDAVVANEMVISDYVESIKHSGLRLEFIDVHDLVTKNFCRVSGQADDTLAVLQFSDNEGMVTIYHQQDLYVARNFKTGLLAVDSVQEGDESTYDSLLLELQRSMDYFESTYGLGVAKQMLIFPQTPGTVRMANYVQNYVAFEMDFIEVNVGREGETEALNPQCFSAYCAALRGIN